ncbi:MAG: DUF288 domain-containing protein [Chthoniobacterales bacterium]|nr:DUF288 domain-containing protein [Chthoniobacterales bacterium]
MFKPTVVVTSISAPNRVLREIADGAGEAGFSFLVIGDTKSPSDFSLEGCEFQGVAQQEESGFAFARLCPVKHYARKNIGYLLAMQRGAPLILETDDDNFPREAFWNERHVDVTAASLETAGWVNVYRYFTEAVIWPRGLPLDEIQTAPPDYESLAVAPVHCPIQQGLADENPDVDAIYRLAFPLPQNFRQDRRVALGSGSWCPFNSQNTAWWPEAYPLMYLPAHCSFRMTDIWRSFVTQRIAWANGWSILFHEPTVWQDRNDHSLMRDFADEVPGYLNNRAIGAALSELELKPGVEQLGANLRICYHTLVERGWIGAAELPLVDAWLADLAQIAQ